MQGPANRIKFVSSRLWECPECHRKEKSPGSVTSKYCGCGQKHAPPRLISMRLIGDAPVYRGRIYERVDED